MIEWGLIYLYVINLFLMDSYLIYFYLIGRVFLFKFGLPGLLQNGVLNRTKLPVCTTNTLPDHIAVLFKLLHSGAYIVYTILADPGKALSSLSIFFYSYWNRLI